MGLKLLDLSGLRALVTGGGTGLGRQMALGLAEAGADIVVCGRRRERIEEAAEEIRGIGVSAEAIPADVTSENDIQHLVHTAGQIDILVNNAGVSRIQPWKEVSLAEWREVFSLNLDAPFRLCQLLAPPMVERRWGRIINVSSIYGVIGGSPDRYPGVAWDLPAYFASKHGLIGLTHYLAVRMAPYGVCINALSPGIFATEGTRERMPPEVRETLIRETPMKRLGEEDDLKAAVVFLASPGSSFVTGQNVIVDGGWTVW